MRYQEFVSMEMKKRPQDVKVTEYMKIIAKKWHIKKGVRQIKRVRKGKGFVKWFTKNIGKIVDAVVSGALALIDEVSGQHFSEVYRIVKSAIKYIKTHDNGVLIAKEALVITLQQIVSTELKAIGIGNIPAVVKLSDYVIEKMFDGIYNALKSGDAPKIISESDMKDFSNETIDSTPSKKEDIIAEKPNGTAIVLAKGRTYNGYTGNFQLPNGTQVFTWDYYNSLSQDELAKFGLKIQKGASLFPVLDYLNWENAFYDQNEDQIVYYINKYGDKVPIDELPTGVGQAVKVLRKYPRQSIQAKRALNTLTQYSPAGLFNMLF